MGLLPSRAIEELPPLLVTASRRMDGEDEEAWYNAVDVDGPGKGMAKIIQAAMKCYALQRIIINSYVYVCVTVKIKSATFEAGRSCLN